MPHPRAARTAHAAPCRKGTINLSLPQAARLEKGKRKKAVSFFTTAAAAVQIQGNGMRLVKNVPCVLYFVISVIYNRIDSPASLVA
jgi:hypothetical protein